MSKLTDTFRNIFKIPELRQRIFYTLALLFIVRLGAHITLPGVDAALLTESMKNASSDNLFGLYDLFVGGAFSNAAIFALGIKTAERKLHNLQGTELLESQLCNPGV
jgi:preprotein translocase subunit SecY